jgi:hypothetical protein
LGEFALAAPYLFCRRIKLSKERFDEVRAALEQRAALANGAP